MNKKNTEISANNINRTSHLSNERTFLAWIRTILGLMAFGFVIERFSVFVQQIGSILGKSGMQEFGPIPSPLQGYSSILGISLVGMGALLCIFAFLKFKKTEKEINDDTYHTPALINAILMLFVLFIGVVLLIYLIKSSVTK